VPGKTKRWGGGGGIVPIHLQLRATRGWMGSVTFQSLYPLH